VEDADSLDFIPISVSQNLQPLTNHPTGNVSSPSMASSSKHSQNGILKFIVF
jgi:hypothetical protein